MGDPMRVRAVHNSGVVEVKVLMKHRMLSRLSWSPEGQLILPHFIQTFRGTCNGRPVLHVVEISWVDTEGDTRTDETTVT